MFCSFPKAIHALHPSKGVGFESQQSDLVADFFLTQESLKPQESKKVKEVKTNLKNV